MRALVAEFTKEEQEQFNEYIEKGFQFGDLLRRQYLLVYQFTLY